MFEKFSVEAFRERHDRTFTLKNMIPLSNTARLTASQISFTVHKDEVKEIGAARSRFASLVLPDAMVPHPYVKVITKTTC